MIQNKEGNTEPLLKAVYNLTIDNCARVEPGMVCRNSLIEKTKAPRLYENLKLTE